MKRYQNIKINRDNKGKRHYVGVKYPPVPLSPDDIYLYTTQGDRFDILAEQYFNDSSLWWIISISNPNLEQNSYTPPIGIQIRIPTNVAKILSDFEKINP